MKVTDNTASNQLVLLHLSDIHFRQPYCLDPSTDKEHAVRQLLVKDIETMVGITGPIDAMLITGDIAFQGHPDEYTAAREWLSYVAEKSGCGLTSIYTVPGNHDVDRNATKNAEVVSIRQKIMEIPLNSGRDKKLHDVVLSDESVVELLRPIESYNLFAARFGCNVSKRPFWTQPRELAPGWKLVIHGLNSTLFSGSDDARGKLYLGGLQQVFPKQNGIIRLAMLHHPPDWLEDFDNIEDSLRNGCELHLLGHKHRSRYLPSDSFITYSAGAVNPSRAEGNWEPGYNIIIIRLIDTPRGCALEVESYLRLWQSSPDQFIPKKTLDGKEVFKHTIFLHRNAAFDSAPSNSGFVTPVETIEGKSEDPMETLTRDLVLKFWSLKTSQRWMIVKSLELLEEEDVKLPEPLRYERAFERARTLGKIGDLAAKIDAI